MLPTLSVKAGAGPKPTIRIATRVLKQKYYELKDHLGNLRATISDLRTMQNSLASATVESYNTYYPFGMLMPGPNRQGASGDYRYGFNGKEIDNDMRGGNGATYDYGFRIYDARIAKFLSVDPLTASYPWYTPYQFAGNMPIWAIDLDGLEEYLFTLDWEDKSSDPILKLESVDEDKVFSYKVNFKQGSFGSKSFTFTELGPYPGTPGKNTIENFLEWLDDPQAYKWPISGETKELGAVFESDAARILLNITRALEYLPLAKTTAGQFKYSKNPKITYSKSQIKVLRKNAVNKAWEEEIELIKRTGKGSRFWSAPEKEELMKNGKVKGYAGHHINDVDNHPELAGNPNNIEFLNTGNKNSGGARKGSEHYQKHYDNNGNRIKKTTGKLINRKN